MQQFRREKKCSCKLFNEFRLEFGLPCMHNSNDGTEFACIIFYQHINLLKLLIDDYYSFFPYFFSPIIKNNCIDVVYIPKGLKSDWQSLYVTVISI